jgi:hypothetical protein
MHVCDLSYLENASENQFILGGASGTITAVASAGGNNPAVVTETDATLKNKKNGGAVFKGTGLALAVGEDPYANVDYTLEGFDKVKVKTKSGDGQYYAYEYVKIKAVDKP